MIHIAYRACRVVLFLAVMLATRTAFAGGGPENVFLVVNRQSVDSLTIANHYIQLRGIPAGNVLTLNWDPKADTTDIDTFRDKILTPILKAIEQRNLVPQIDYIVYSSDFPAAVNLGPDVERFKAEAAKEDSPNKALKNWPQILTPVGSLNGLTYLWQPVMAKSPGYFETRVNYYARREASQPKEAPSAAFKATQAWNPSGESIQAPARRYVLSTMLGVTAGRGNTLDEVLSYLKQSAAADGTHPKGTIYFAQNGDVRSTVRHRVFPDAIRLLKAMNIDAEIVEGVMPMNKSDVQGVVVGAADFKWEHCKSTILPGAICEHFTSYGGMMAVGAGQTPLSEFLRYGAAGASGTVTEPYAIFEKFPSPMIQVHYARGCTLAEAFYQSVSSPYQLLIVGDPLCRPWANIPEVKVAGVQAGDTVKGLLKLKATAVVPGGGKADHYELFVDELRRSECGETGELTFDTALMGDGFHELRVVALEAGKIRSQGRTVLPIHVNNHGRTIEARLEPRAAAAPITVTAKSPGALGILVLNNAQMVGKINGEEGRVEIAPEVVGRGRVKLRVIGFGNGDPHTFAFAQPLEVDVAPPGKR